MRLRFLGLFGRCVWIFWVFVGLVWWCRVYADDISVSDVATQSVKSIVYGRVRDVVTPLQGQILFFRFGRFYKVQWETHEWVIPLESVEGALDGQPFQFSMQPIEDQRTVWIPMADMVKVFSPVVPTVSVASFPLVYIDAGHGGEDPGALGLRGCDEKTYVLDIALTLEKMVLAHGWGVLMARDRDETVSLKDRVDMANSQGASVFVSIHLNSYSLPQINGTETYYMKSSDYPLAITVHRHMMSALRLKNNGVKQDRLYVLRSTDMPAVLVEPLFLTNPRESLLIDQPKVRHAIANAIMKGLREFFAPQ